ncbi:L,D-transpeptidase family protein [Hymenobacter artigasi]|uniref:Murein L,D-transpeptidase YcbB/YkuD n=1 Tax=Hymenobacter artigasi TaxID=2719616 RepID=A0ABX1HH28_9BACT|nr:L,D-transpeptidase family protein [Hymenobacter artigasi]NKI89155.1 murein L,D-transpeptidase YcbB/YkuD [Hymenobacter artigasi]
MRPLKSMLLAASLTAILFGLTSADRLAAPRALAPNYPADSLAGRIQRLLAVPAAERALPLALADEPAVQAFYTQRQHSAAWCADAGAGPKGRAALALLTQASDYGLTPAVYHVPLLKALADSLAQPAGTAGQVARQARFDVLLTDGVVLFARHLRRGQLHAFTPSPLEKAGAPFEPAAWVARALAAPGFAAALLRCQPPQREYRELQKALARWRRQPATGNDAPAHRRRSQQMALTLERWRWEAIPGSEYLLVNLPAYQLEVVRKGRVQLSQRIMIGRPDRPTPTLNSRVTSFTIAPEWNVPHDVAVRHILPYLKANARYAPEQDFLANNNYRLFDAQGKAVNPATVNWQRVTVTNFPYTIRQSPGCGNLLGNIIFRFPNPYGLYLSDAPEPGQFAHAYRALEEGCMKLARPMHLAAYLLGPDSTSAALPTEAQCTANPQPRTIFLKRPLPLHVRYATCAVVAGRLRFYPDVYGLDATLRRQLLAMQAAAQRSALPSLRQRKDATENQPPGTTLAGQREER